jgi:hypothetical protein
MRKDVRTLLAKIDRSKLQTNTQKVLYRLLNAENEWVSRSTIRIPSVGSRLRDLRKPQYGSFTVECETARSLQKRTRAATNHPTFYRLNSSSVTREKVASIFKGVISTTK